VARISVRVFRYAAVLLATIGLGALYLMATHREIPIVEIGSIEPTMNFAYVRVEGNVTEEARVNREGGHIRSVRFVVDDGTGEIPVTAFRAKGQELVDADLLPSVGDHVLVTGSLSVSAERVGLWLQSPRQLVIERAQVVKVLLGEISDSDLGSTVMVEGRITSVVPPRQDTRRPWVIVLQDASGKQEVSFWQDVYDVLGNKVQFAPGSHVRATVAVGSFRGKVQLRLAAAEDIAFIDAPAATGRKEKTPVTALGDVTPGQEGRYVKVEGKVVSVTPPGDEHAPYVVLLRDDTGELPVVYWESIAKGMLINAPVEGATWQAIGRVNVYSNRVQVKVNRAKSVKRITGPR
jgi:DNA/RNA endonuclease YhcR with UshA esterase domain